MFLKFSGSSADAKKAITDKITPLAKETSVRMKPLKVRGRIIMWQFAHLASGALVGQQAQNPMLAFGLGVGVHLLIDKIPHYWPNSDKQKFWFTVIDYMITVPTIFWLISNFQTNQSGMIWGIVGSLLVDIVLVGIPSIHKSKLGLWHYKRQPHHANPLYLLTDAAVIAMCISLLVK